MSDELFMDYVVGYRTWRLENEGDRFGCLLSIGGFGEWEEGENVARCKRPLTEQTHDQMSSKSPDGECACGLYAYYEPIASRDGTRKPGPGRTGFNTGFQGAVVAWGKMQIHPLGFRAERARVVALLTEGNEHQSAARLLAIATAATKYRVPLVGTVEELRALALEQGQELPESVRPVREPLPPYPPSLVGLVTQGGIRIVQPMLVPKRGEPSPNELFYCRCTTCDHALASNRGALEANTTRCPYCAKRERDAQKLR